MTFLLPDVTVRVAASEAVSLSLDGSSGAAFAVVTPRIGEAVKAKITDGAITLPSFQYPNFLTVEWGGSTAYIELVSRHYFRLEDLKAYGGEMDDFEGLGDAVLSEARQAATEVFEAAACRSFVQRLGKTKDYGRGRILDMAHNDVSEILTPGYALISDSQAERTSLYRAYPAWVEYRYGMESIPSQVSRAVLELAAYMLRPANRPVGATGESTDAGYIHFTTAGRDGATDIPEVNAAIEQFGRRRLAW